MPDTSTVAGERLRALLERIERLEEEKKGIAADIRDIYAEGKGSGFDVKIMRQIIRRRRMQQHERREQDELLDLYQAAIGME